MITSSFYIMAQLYCFAQSNKYSTNSGFVFTIIILGRPMKENHWVNAVTVTWVESTFGRKYPKVNAVIRFSTKRRCAVN